MAIRALRVLSGSVFLGLFFCHGVSAAFAQTQDEAPKASTETQQESEAFRTEVSADFPGVFLRMKSIPIGTTAAYRVNDHLKVFYRFAHHKERHEFAYYKNQGMSRAAADIPLVTDVFTHGPGLRFFPASRGTFNLSTGIDFTLAKGKATGEATVREPGPKYRYEPVRMESNLNEARVQVFIGNAWELGRFRLTCDWFGIEKQFLVLSEKTSVDNFTTSSSRISTSNDDGLSKVRREFTPVFLRLSTGMAF